MEKFTVELLIANHFGVLNRITTLYAKRGYNIDSLNVKETEDPEFSKMSIVSRGDEYTKTQTLRQLNKLYDVKEVALMDRG